MKCLVTGATGFVGGELAERLEARGRSVERCGREAPGDAQLDAAAILYHCAGIAHRAASEAEYETYNYRATLALAERAAAAGIRRFVFLSSVNAAESEDEPRLIHTVRGVGWKGRRTGGGRRPVLRSALLRKPGWHPG